VLLLAVKLKNVIRRGVRLFRGGQLLQKGNACCGVGQLLQTKLLLELST
jgi:hypothetical protein